MIGIYQDNILDYLESKLGGYKTSAKNIIIPCPWCEANKPKPHYHMYISLELPIFHCFHASCEQSGTLRKLLKALEGHDISNQFVDKQQFAEIKRNQEVFKSKEINAKEILLPVLDRNAFLQKEAYVNTRLKYANYSTNKIKGLIYDVDAFIELNNVPVTETLFKIQPYLQNNFVGFLTENQSTVMFRNVNHKDDMKFYKMKLQEVDYLDYFKLKGNDHTSNKIVLAEGIFDIFSEHIFDSLNIKSGVRLYASALSSKYLSLIHSIIFHEQIFQPEVIILSDKGISRDYYKKMKHFNKHIINKMTIYYNKAGKDFNDTPIVPVKFVM